MSDARHRPRWVPILLYHSVVREQSQRDPFGKRVSLLDFEKQMEWLASHGYTSVPLGLAADLADGHQPAVPTPPRPVVITFDDGYRDNYLNAWPVLRRFGLTATIFLVSDAIGGDSSFDARWDPDIVPMLSGDEIREMHGGGIDFGSHTCTHPDSLVTLNNARLDYELQRSRAVIEGVIGAAVRHFSYPHSVRDDRVEAAVERADYRTSCAGVGTRHSRFALSRIDPSARVGHNLALALLERQMKWRFRRQALALRVPG